MEQGEGFAAAEPRAQEAIGDPERAAAVAGAAVPDVGGAGEHAAGVAEPIEAVARPLTAVQASEPAAEPARPLAAAPASEPAATTHTGPTATRRRFVKYLLGFSAASTLALIAAPVVAFLVPPKESAAGTGGKTLAGTVQDIPPGKGKVVAMGSKPTIVVNTDQGVKAFSAICTHLGCIVAYDDQSGSIACPCHGGRFSPTTGAVQAGPPPAPLAPVTVSVEGDQIFLVSA